MQSAIGRRFSPMLNHPKRFASALLLVASGSVLCDDRGMTKRRGSPDQRGMGAQSDFISEVFHPSGHNLSERIARAKILISTGMSPEGAAAMLSIRLEQLSEEALRPQN